MKNLKVKIFAILVYGLFFFGIEFFIKTQINQHLENYTTELEIKQKTIQKSNLLTAEAIFNTIINKPQMLQLYSKAYKSDSTKQIIIRDSLYNILLQDFDYLNSNNITLLQFHLPDNVSFLRFHRPEKYGDDLSNKRYSVKTTNLSKKKQTGFEQGKLLSSFRYVFPLIYNNIHLGSVEISFSFNAVMQQLKLKQNNDFFGFMIKKDIINAKVLYNEKSNYQACLFSEKYMQEKKRLHYKNDTANIFMNIDTKIKNKISKQLSKNENFAIYQKAGNAYYLVSFISIKNVEGKPAAYVFAYHKDKVINEYKRQHYLIHIFTFILFSVLAYFVLLNHKKNRKIKESEEKLQTWIQNSSVCTKVVDLDFNLQFMSISGIKGLKIDDITEFYGKPYPLHFFPDLFKISMADNLKKVKETGENIQMEGQLSDTKGNKLWFLHDLVPVNDENGKLDYILVVSMETTKRMQAEEKINKKSIELKNQFKKSEEQRIATLTVLSDLNETTRNLEIKISEHELSEKIQKALFNISNALNTTDNMQDFYNKIRKFLGNVIDTTNFYVALYDEKTDIISLPFDVDEKDDYETFPAGKTLSKYVIQTGKSLFAPKQLQDELNKQSKIDIIGTQSEIWLGVPLKIENKVVGVIAVQSYDDPNLYAEKDLEIISFVSEEIALAIKQKRATDQIKQDLKIKTALIQEIYHRTKNNMAVISAMISIQSRHSENDYVKSTFREISNKIQAMALVHQKLYKAKDLSNINLKDYIEDLANLIMQSYGALSERIKMKFDLQDVKILIDSAVPLGLIINELISNIFKHAFPNRQEGEIFIRLFKEKDKTINLELFDNGIGFPQNFDPRKDGSMGLASIFSIAENQLKGEISVKSENGLKWCIKIKDDKKKERV